MISIIFCLASCRSCGVDCRATIGRFGLFSSGDVLIAANKLLFWEEWVWFEVGFMVFVS